MKRRISAILLVIALLVSLIPTVVIAADTFKLNPVASVESVSVENPIAKGKTVTITLNYVNWPEKVDALQIDMTYDQTKFSCKPAGVKAGSVPADPYTEEAPSFAKNAANGKVSAGYTYYIAGEATASGTIMTVTFAALEDITSSCEFGIVVKTLVIGGVSSTDALETPEKLTIAGGVTPPARTHDLKKVDAKPATCTEAGNKEYWECKTCGNFYWDADGKNEITNKNEVISEAGHKYGDLIAEVSATCGKDGVKAHYECSVCHKYFDTNYAELTDLVIPATGNHDWELVKKEVEGADKHTKKCKVCNKTEEETHDKWEGDKSDKWESDKDNHWHQFACGTIMDKAAHTWDAGVVATPATCTTAGVKTYTCDVCKHTKTVTIPKVDHQYEWKHDETNHWQECSVCHDIIDKAEHTYASHKCEDTATCTKAGCGYVKPAGQHSWNDGEVTTPATCTTDGVKTYTCKVCSETKTEPIKASGHSLTKVEAVAATCTEGGNNEYYTCSVCKKVFKADKTTETTVADETLAALGHKLTKTEAKAATCTEPGNNAYWTCDICGRVFKDEQGTQPTTVDAETINATGHTPKTDWATDGDYHWHVCDKCGAVVGDKAAHTFDTNDCTKDRKCTECNYEKKAGQHTWGEKTYTWSDDFKCTAATKCISCQKPLTETVDGVKTTVPATCVADGKDIYTATFTNTAFETQTKEVTIEKLGHTYGAPVWSWSEDGKTATATFTCTREGCTAETTGHAQTMTATVSGKQNVAPTCTDKGTTTYTAKVTFEKKDYADTKDVQDIKALGHKLTKTAAKVATCTEPGNSEYYTCGTCGKFFSDKDGKNEIVKDSWVIKALGHKLTETPAVTPTCAAGGNNEYWTCSVCHKVFKADKTTETTVAAETLAKDPANHTGGTEQRGAVAASCMTAGRTADIYCKGCGEKLSKDDDGKIIPATGIHNYVDGVCTTCGSKQPADNATIKAAIKDFISDVVDAAKELEKKIEDATDENTKKILGKLKGYVGGSSRSKLQAVYGVTMSLNGQDLGKGDSLADGQNVTIAISEETYNALKSGAKIVESYLDDKGEAQTREINATLKQVGGGYTVTFASDKTAVYGLMTKTSSGGSSGSGSSYTSGQSFTTDLPADSINRVTVNGKKLDSKYYTVSSNGSGSIVTLTDAYLATLKAGKYTVKIENKTHVSTGTFTIKADGTLSSPKTADAGIALYAMLAVSSLMGTAVVSKKRRKA